jgi:hypothetical protein
MYKSAGFLRTNLIIALCETRLSRRLPGSQKPLISRVSISRMIVDREASISVATSPVV